MRFSLFCGIASATDHSHGRGGISSQPVPVDQAIQAGSDENRPCPRGPSSMAKALGGRFDQKFATGGSTSTVMFPSSSKPQITANRRPQHRVSLANGDMVSVLNLDPALPIPQSNGSSMSRKQR